MGERKPALSQRITLRLPKDTATSWRQRADAADQSLSDWLRSAVDGESARQTGQRRNQRRLRTLTADPELLRQLAALGSNVNQIARVLNSIGMSPSDHAHLLAELAAIQGELHRLAELPRYDKDDEGSESPCTLSS
ncbi:MAG: plasmid mobilization relaxosome protein MobC [Halomonas sp.]|nr:plasmid mobilization relaxosome protein MobC [Halomonas sp.]MDN6337074.1 plasmid mobilization relaxosome protein MobC [Halomonas sp.]